MVYHVRHIYRHLGMARVSKGSHSFTCHITAATGICKWKEPCLPLLPAAEHHCTWKNSHLRHGRLSSALGLTQIRPIAPWWLVRLTEGERMITHMCPNPVMAECVMLKPLFFLSRNLCLWHVSLCILCLLSRCKSRNSARYFCAAGSSAATRGVGSAERGTTCAG